MTVSTELILATLTSVRNEIEKSGKELWRGTRNFSQIPTEQRKKHRTTDFRISGTEKPVLVRVQSTENVYVMAKSKNSEIL